MEQSEKMDLLNTIEHNTKEGIELSMKADEAGLSVFVIILAMVAGLYAWLKKYEGLKDEEIKC